VTDLTTLRKKLDSHRATYTLALAQAAQEEEALREARGQEEVIRQAQALVQEVAEGVQAQAHAQIAGVVSRCLKTVFGEDAYEFRIVFERKRGRTEARLCLVRGGQEINPTEAAGGGVVDVASFALRLACLVLVRPLKRKLLVLDEPFKHLSREYRPAVAELVLLLARELGVQFLIVSHARDFAVGKVVEF
jgi:DNA repair exonuclease SbcCD ATPase subunit